MFTIKQIIVRLDDTIHQNLKIKTVQDGISIQKLVEEFVNTYLDKNISAQELLEKLQK